MHRSILALVALVAFAIGTSAAYACPAHTAHVGTTTKQSVASVDGATTPITVPKGGGS